MADELVRRIDAALADLVERRCPVLTDAGERLDVVLEVAREFLLTGGKRMRPTFCYWGWRGAGAADQEPIIVASASLELVHAFALVHDDVMDDSDIRRGSPTVHRRFAGLHARSGWRGSATGFGMSVAVLVGDLYAAWAQDMFTNSGVGRAALDRARPLFDLLHSEVIAGQYLDVVGQVSGDASPEFARRIALYKSGKYSVERPLQIGGALAGAGPELLGAYSRYGRAVGEAFQLRDDMLGVFGRPDTTGKPNMDDLRSGKPTVMAALARTLGTRAQRAVLDRYYGRPDLDPAGADTLREVFVETGAADTVERRIDELLDRSLDAFTAHPVDAEAATALAKLASAATHRST